MKKIKILPRLGSYSLLLLSSIGAGCSTPIHKRLNRLDSLGQGI
ncbi:MAG: hypothetical protein V9H26_23065 [Verrucomicrobiota bacterium]